MLEIADLRAGYGDAEILHGLTFSVEPRKIVSLIGPNGCGKTTLLRAMCGLLPVSGGAVRLEGREIKEYGRKEFARLAAFLPQTRNVPAITAERLVSHGRYPHLSFGRSLTEQDREIVRRAMETTGTLEFRDRELSSLSGGQRQRVYLAMTLAQEAEILFLDEPTTYLDVGQKFQVMELVLQLKAMGKTVVMALHDLPLAFACSDAVAVLEKGVLREYGPAEAVFDSGAPGRAFGVHTEKITLNGKKEYLFLK